MSTAAEDIVKAAFFKDFKSQDIYLKTWKQYSDWKTSSEIEANDDSQTTVLAFFHYLKDEKGYAPSTLWTKSGHLKKCLQVLRQVDLSKYTNVTLTLKQWSKHHVKKKSKVFSMSEVFRYFEIAPNNIQHIEAKAALAFGYFGTLRCDDLCKLTWECVTDEGSVMAVRLDFDRKTGTENSHFRIPAYPKGGCPLQAVREFREKSVSKSHPKNEAGRVFRTIRDGRVIDNSAKGKNMVRKIPKLIAEFLQLPDPHLYTGQCFRRTSATALADSGASRLQLKRAGCWKSDSVAEGYINDSKRLRTDIASSLLPASTNDEKENAPRAAPSAPLSVARATATRQPFSQITPPENAMPVFNNCSNFRVIIQNTPAPDPFASPFAGFRRPTMATRRRWSRQLQIEEERSISQF